jgi:hypothetical protein
LTHENRLEDNVCKIVGHDWVGRPELYCDQCSRCGRCASWLDQLGSVGKITEAMAAPLRQGLDYASLSGSIIQTEKIELSEPIELYDEDIPGKESKKTDL